MLGELITKQEGVKYTVFHCIHFLPCIPLEYTYSFFISSYFPCRAATRPRGSSGAPLIEERRSHSVRGAVRTHPVHLRGNLSETRSAKPLGHDLSFFGRSKKSSPQPAPGGDLTKISLRFRQRALPSVGQIHVSGKQGL